MSKFEAYLIEEHTKAYLIEDGESNGKSKDDYITNAEEGTIVAFRLNFESRRGVPLTKVISGKIIENNVEKEILVVETRNGLRYGVPYSVVVWVKTGERWPKGVYEEMKQGSVEFKEDTTEFDSMEEDVDFDDSDSDEEDYDDEEYEDEDLLEEDYDEEDEE